MINNGFFYGGEIAMSRFEYVDYASGAVCVICEKREQYFAYNAQYANNPQCANVPQPPYSHIPYQPSYDNFEGFFSRAAIGFPPPFAKEYYPERVDY